MSLSQQVRTIPTTAQDVHFEIPRLSNSSGVAQPSAGDEEACASEPPLVMGLASPTGQLKGAARKRPARSDVISSCSARRFGIPRLSEDEEAEADAKKVVVLQLKRPHYDAIKSGRTQWVARTLYENGANQASLIG